MPSSLKHDHLTLWVVKGPGAQQGPNAPCPVAWAQGWHQGTQGRASLAPLFPLARPVGTRNELGRLKMD